MVSVAVIEIFQLIFNLLVFHMLSLLLLLDGIQQTRWPSDLGYRE